ncbi:Sterile alpha and TIR motif-containing protein 1, partial [Harpegnathos saltator]
VVTDGFSAEKATANSAEMRALQAGDVSYKEQSAATAARARVELDGVSAEKSVASAREQRSLKAGDLSHQESNNMAASTMKLQSDSFSSEKKAMAAQQQRQTVTSTGIFNHEKHIAASSQSSITIASKGVTSKSSMISAASAVNQLMNGIRPAEDELLSLPLDDLDLLCSKSNPQDVDRAISKYCGFLDSFVERLKANDGRSGKAPLLLNRVNEIIRKAWAVPTHGHELGYTLCNTLRTRGGLDILMSNCVANDHELQFSSARLLEQCLTTENRAHVVENGLEKVVNVACVCTKNANSVDHSRVGTGILEHLFKHSEGTCSDVIRLGGLDAVLFECRKNDVETLRHCAGALANLSLYGGAENQEAMIKRKVPMWLFPLAFHNDDNIKYYACLAIAVLVANKEIEAAVLKSGTLDLVEPFVTSHNPYEFAKSNLAHAHGQSKNWLERLVPVLSSKREEARNLAAFHFCMEAGIKQRQGNTEIFREIGAIEPLKKVASCPNAIASKYAAQALRLIGEEIPHKLSQQVPLWSTEDVREWVKQIGFAECAVNFAESRVDGDLLLQLTEENLREDIGLTNGIMRRRFARELQNLKKMADYSSRDTGNLNSFLQSIGQEFSIYTYGMLNAGVDKESIRNLSEDQLLAECGITNSIHRLRILNAIKNMQHNQFSSCEYESPDKCLDVFVSYRRSNGSQLASLLKVHLQLRGFSVFIDVERLEAGKFDNNLLQSIKQAKHFLLVLTPQALERCVQDSECKDWVHREIVAALQSDCNIIPIIDQCFQWPEPEELPEDMRAVCHFNGVRWIHDYQDACVDKLERFMRGELPMRPDLSGGIPRSMAPKDVTTPSTPGNTNMRQPPSYQRMHSNESRSSDKDSTAKIANRAKTIATRLRKSSSPFRWLMGLPPASPRFKFVHAHPGDGSGSPAVPRRPPRQQAPPPSARSRSLELLDQGQDQDEEKEEEEEEEEAEEAEEEEEEEERKSAISATIVQTRPPLPRPRSRSLDGLLDEDAKSVGGGGSCDRSESCEQDRQKSSKSHVARKQEAAAVEIVTSVENPMPVPRARSKFAEGRFETEDTRTSLDSKDENEKGGTPPTRPPKPNRRSSSLEGRPSTLTISGKQCDEQERRIEEQETMQNILTRVGDIVGNDVDDDNDDDRSTILKARSCGAGLDSEDGSVSSSEYGGNRSADAKRGPGSLLSLPAGAEPKRKRNFMDKCVNKVRSFMRK